MEKQIYRFILWLLMLILANLFMQKTLAQKAKYMKEKNITKTFQANNFSQLSIENRFGKIHIHPSTDNQIKVEINIITRASTEKKAEEMLQKIDIQVIQNAPNISLKTILDKQKVSTFSGIVQEVKTEMVKSSDFEINYKAFIPKQLGLDLKNKFGDIYIGEHSGSLNIDLSYGTLKTDKIAGMNTNKIKVGFGNARIGFMEQGSLKMAYSNLNLENANKITLENSYSNTEAEEIKDLYLICKYGNVKIGNAQNVEGTSVYSGFRIDNLAQNLKMQVKYSSGFKIHQIGNDFKLIDINSQFSSFIFDFNDGNCADFDLSLKYGSMKCDAENISYTQKEQSDFSAVYVGKLGNKKVNCGKIIIKATYGDVKFK